MRRIASANKVQPLNSATPRPSAARVTLVVKRMNKLFTIILLFCTSVCLAQAVSGDSLKVKIAEDFLKKQLG